MFLESNFTEQFEKADNRCKELLTTALADIPAEGDSLSYETFDDLYAAEFNQQRVFLIEQGAVGHEQDDKTLFHYDEGDIIGLELSPDMPRPKFYAQSPVILRPYNREALWQTAMADANRARRWGEYLLAECGRHSAVMASLDIPADKASLGFETYAAGTTIIEEGTESDAVYSIVEGTADVFVKGIKVGEVLENEIFGAMSLLTNSLRTATVVAHSQCLVMVVPRHQFETMIRTHPRICMSLMENMARQIISLNEKVTASQ